MADVLANLDGNIAYGKPLKRSALSDCDKVYLGTPCSFAELRKMAGGSDDMFFGTKPAVSIEDALDQLRQQFQEHDSRIERQEKQIEEMKDYVYLETTPSMICAGVIGSFRLKIQEEFERTARFVSCQPELSGIVKALKQFVKKQTPLQNWQFDELCFRFCESERDCDPADAGELMKLLIHTSMASAIAAAPDASSDVSWVREWKSFFQMVKRRHKGGHPNVKHDPEETGQSTEETERVARVHRIYKNLVVEPGHGLGQYPDFGLKDFLNVARAALNEEPRKLTPCSVSFGGEVELLMSLIGPAYERENRTYCVVEEQWLADFSIIYLSTDWREDITRSFVKGVKKIVAVTKSEPEREYLKRLSKRNHATIHFYDAAAGDDVTLLESMRQGLDKLSLSRPSSRSSFIMVAASVNVSTETTSGRKTVAVFGRIERGSIAKGMQLVFEGGGMTKSQLEANSFTVVDVDVQHTKGKAVPGAQISVKLTGLGGLVPLPGMLLSDFREAVSSRLTFQAVVVNVGSGVFTGGHYKLQCSVGLDFDVEVQLKGRLEKYDATRDGGRPVNLMTLVNGQKMVRTEVLVLRKTESGEVTITSSTPMPVLPALKQVAGNCGCSRFCILSGSVIVLAGQAE